MANLQHLKASRTRVLNAFPSPSFGKDGDIVISRISGKGVYVCTKAGGTWYTATKMEELRNHGKTSISQFKADKILINKLTNTSNDTNKFIVGDAGRLMYRTGEQIVDDLDIPVQKIDYKASYCSLGQYTNKKDCKTNGGTWYYSENDSHDSISSTAENEILTVSSSIGKLDAEPTLTYDGSQLEIKYNSDFDDNWQTSAQTDLLKLTYDSDNYCNISVAASGVTTIATADSDGTLGHLILDADGLIKLDSHSGYFYFYQAGDTADYMRIRVSSAGETTIQTYDDVGSVGHINLTADGNILLQPSATNVRFQLNATNYCNFNMDATGATNITTVDSDGTLAHLTLAPNGDLNIEADGHVEFDNCAVGFDRLEATFSLSGIIGSGGSDDTDINFRLGNKYRLELSSDIAQINLIFPATSGNFVLVCHILGSGGGNHDITAWKVYASDAGAATTTDVMWPGGSRPAFTSGAATDIVSFYWDADEEQCYGVASLAFATP